MPAFASQGLGDAEANSARATRNESCFRHGSNVPYDVSLVVLNRCGSAGSRLMREARPRRRKRNSKAPPAGLAADRARPHGDDNHPTSTTRHMGPIVPAERNPTRWAGDKPNAGAALGAPIELTDRVPRAAYPAPPAPPASTCRQPSRCDPDNARVEAAPGRQWP